MFHVRTKMCSMKTLFLSLSFLTFVSLYLLWHFSVGVRVVVRNKQVFWNCRDNDMFPITFDDGPFGNEHIFLAALQEFRKRNISATFYWIGIEMEKHVELVKMMDKDPLFMLGTHTQDHPDLSADLPREQVEKQIFGAVRTLEKITGKRYRHLRPPYLTFDNFGVVENSNLSVDMSSIDVSDWKINAEVQKKYKNKTLAGEHLRNEIIEALKEEFKSPLRGRIFGGHERELVFQEIANILDFLQDALKGKAIFVRMDECTGIPETF